jgi:hypothetical protein
MVGRQVRGRHGQGEAPLPPELGADLPQGAFPIAYDPVRNVIALDGEAGVAVMLALLLKAKFGEAYDPEVLFHEELAQIMCALNERVASPAGEPKAPDAGSFPREDLFQIAEAIVDESWRSGWWMKTPDERVAYIRDVVAAPHGLSREEMEILVENIDSVMFNLRRVANAAEEAGEPR